jgi:hypothetical protein
LSITSSLFDVVNKYSKESEEKEEEEEEDEEEYLSVMFFSSTLGPSQII